MRLSILVIITTLLPVYLCGQIGACAMETTSGKHEYRYNIDPMPDQLDMGSSGPDNQWIFTRLQSPRTYTFSSLEGDQGEFSQFFDDAKRVVQYPDGTEIYLMTRGNHWYKMGEVVPATTQHEAQIRKYNVPMRYCAEGFGKSYRSSTHYMLGDEKVDLYMEGQVDATGMLFLPDGYYDVKRLRRKFTSTQEGVTTTLIKYDFVDHITGELLLQLSIDGEDQITQAIYKTNREIAGRSLSSGTDQFYLYPNTGYGDIRMEFTNFKPGNYQLIIKDIVGRQIWHSHYTINSDKTIKEDLTFLPRGTYNYVLVDKDYNIVVARRLAIIKS